MNLEARDTTVRRSVVTALSGITTSLSTGSITAICGPNGAGKSTLLAVLAGLLAPTSGEVLLDGDPLASFHPQERARKIGYLPQTGEIAWDLSVKNLVALGRLPHRDRGLEQIEAALAAVHLTELSNRPVSTLSGGERGRALLARVFAGDPCWVLADEPLAALDLYHQHEVLAALDAATRQGIGVVLVLHDLGLAMNHADRVLVLDKGQLVADGPPEEALGVETIMRSWGVSARWIGEKGARALVAR